MYRLRQLVLFLFVFAVAGCGSPDTPPPDEHPALETIGMATATALDVPVPSFRETSLDGRIVETASFRDRISLVNFWATWCGPCIVETPELVGLQAEWSERPFQVIGVSLDTYADDEVRTFVEEMGVQYPVFVDTIGVADAFGGAYALPTTYLVDETGTIVTRYVGLFPMEHVRGRLDSLVTQLEQSLASE